MSSYSNATLAATFIAGATIVLGEALGAPSAAADLNPVTRHPAPAHPPVALVVNGEPAGEIVAPKTLSRNARATLADLQSLIARSTGATLPIVEKAGDKPAIIIGQAPQGVAGALPREGFEIRTEPGRVFITGADNNGMSWGMLEFLERCVGVRFYWPGYSDHRSSIGTSLIETNALAIAPLHITDAPAFPMRVRWPSGGHEIGNARMSEHDRRLRCANTWPIELIVHAPHGWNSIYAKTRPEIFQLRRDGGRDFGMLCYGNPMTLQTYLEEIELQTAGQFASNRGRSIMKGKAVTVSPGDMEVSCRCDHCRALWDEQGGMYGTASRVLGTFVATLAREMKTRWPDLTIIYLPYKNYTYAPAGITFPGNVEVQLCGMPGLALYKDKTINAAEQANIDAWVALTGRRIQNWHYSCWPENRTDAAYLFPRTIQRHYQANRDKTVGTFINGVGDHWPRQHLSKYVWLKVLWNPDVNVDAVVEEYCRRMYGPAGNTMRELVGMLIAGWEGTDWDPPMLSPTTVYEQSYPREDVLKMEALLAQAFAQAEGNATVVARLNYYARSLRAFFAESKLISEGVGIKPFNIYQTGEDPVVDGNLDESVWQDVTPLPFSRVHGKEEPRFPTTVKAVWSTRGVTFGFRMHEPEPEKIQRDIGQDSRDASLIWWNDNIEIFLDPTGTRSGYYHLIVNANGAIFDAKERDASWDKPEIRTATLIGPDFWSLEVFVPYAVFDSMASPATGVAWHGNFTRHRVTDRRSREYQGFNVSTGNPSHNQNAFGPLRFIER